MLVAFLQPSDLSITELLVSLAIFGLCTLLSVGLAVVIISFIIKLVSPGKRQSRHS